jgi:hypothetical protein
MSDGYDAWVFFSRALPPRNVILQTHDALLRFGASQDDYCCVFFNDRGTEEREPEAIHDAAVALDRLCGWSALGGMSYWLRGHISVFYCALPGSSDVECVTIGIPEFAHEGAGQTHLALLHLLHGQFGALRTIFDWALTPAFGFDWTKELCKVRRGEFTGRYRLLDLHD